MSVDLKYILDSSDISALTEVLTPICNKWVQLATALALPNHIIQQCHCRQLVLCMNNVIREWIAGNGVDPKTLGTLKSKLESNTVGEKAFARMFIAKFNQEKLSAAASPEVASPGNAAAGV